MVHRYYENGVCGGKARVQYNTFSEGSANMHKIDIERKYASLPMDSQSQKTFSCIKKIFFDDFVNTKKSNNRSGSFVERMVLKHYSITLLAHMLKLWRPVLDPILPHCCRITSKFSGLFKKRYNAAFHGKQYVDKSFLQSALKNQQELKNALYEHNFAQN